MGVSSTKHYCLESFHAYFYKNRMSKRLFFLTLFSNLVILITQVATNKC